MPDETSPENLPAVGHERTGSEAAPYRVRLSRRKGWRMPANTVKVDRTNRAWGNPFKVGQPGIATSADAVARFEMVYKAQDMIEIRAQIRRELGGKNLGCWCRLDAPCHADTLLRIANEPQNRDSETDHRIRCDGCGDRWGKSFFCKRCSERETYLAEDDGTGWFERKDICGNCCMCHLRGRPVLTATEDDAPDDIPF